MPGISATDLRTLDHIRHKVGMDNPARYGVSDHVGVLGAAWSGESAEQTNCLRWYWEGRATGVRLRCAHRQHSVLDHAEPVVDTAVTSGMQLT